MKQKDLRVNIDMTKGMVYCPNLDLLVNLYMTNGFSHRYQLVESTFIIRGVRSDFFFVLF